MENTVQDVKEVLKKVLREELVALVRDHGDDALVLHLVGGQEFVLRIEKA
jgi:hypothetical protein